MIGRNKTFVNLEKLLGYSLDRLFAVGGKSSSIFEGELEYTNQQPLKTAN